MNRLIPITHEKLTREQEATYPAGGVTKDQMVATVYPLVLMLASKRIARSRNRVSPEDVVQQGLLGVLHALTTFDPTRGRWPSWASAWARTYMARMPGYTQPGFRPGDSSLDRRVCRESMGSFMETVASPERASQSTDTCRRLLQVLDMREAYIVARLAVDEEPGPELGAELGLSRQRISQINHSALAKLRKALTPADLSVL
jgi:RNA polymerase sigma factor (sigma-70 family)